MTPLRPGRRAWMGIDMPAVYVTSAARGLPASGAYIAFWAGCALAGGRVVVWSAGMLVKGRGVGGGHEIFRVREKIY